jgi:hypothetical protein
VQLVGEFVGGGCLTDIVTQLEQNPLSEPQIAYIVREILLGLEYIHNLGCIHRDIKSDQVLLGVDGAIKLGMHTHVFGVSVVDQQLGVVLMHLRLGRDRRWNGTLCATDRREPHCQSGGWHAILDGTRIDPLAAVRCQGTCHTTATTATLVFYCVHMMYRV